MTPWLKADLVMIQKVEEAGQGQPFEIVVKVKGDKIRTDVSPEVSTITNTATGETITLRHSQKTCLRLNDETLEVLQKKLERLQEDNRKNGVSNDPVKLESTGKKETVAGQETKIYTAQAGNIRMTYWIAEKMPDSEKFLEVLNRLQKSTMAKLGRAMTNLSPEFQFPGIPVKTEMVTPDGRKISTTIISIKDEPLEEMDFTVPKEYRSLPIPIFRPPSEPQ